MKLNQRPNLRTWLLGVFAGSALLGLIAGCIAPRVQAPTTSQSTPQTTATVEVTATMTATVMVTPTTVVTSVNATPGATITATTVVTANTAMTTSQPITPTTGVTTTGTTTYSASSAVASTERYKDLPVGFTKEGYPYRGNPNALITMYEYSDYQCPFCERYFITTQPAIDESYVRSGKLLVIFRDFPLEQLHPNAPAAAYAANCVAAQGATKFWTMHDQLFQTQNAWANLSDPKAYFTQLAQKVGANLASYTKCMESGAKTTFVQNGFAEAEKKGYSGTPSFQFIRTATNETFPLVGAQPFDQFANLIDALVAGKKPQQAQADANQQGGQQIPFWATAEGLKPDPSHPGYTVAGDEYRGNPDAKVVVVEFSDFQCPFCRRHFQDTEPTLDKTFVQTNKIFWVFKNFPLSIHPQAEAAAIAAECAAAQGKFWEMHDALFKDVSPWSISQPNPVFTGMAKQLGMDGDKFTKCLSDESDKSAKQRVLSDMQDGQPFVQGTPTFIVLFGGQGRIIPGALPVDRFTQALQQVLDGTIK